MEGYGFIFAKIGGATASIGDPSGRRSERPVLEWKEIESHAQSIHQQIQKLFSNQRSKWIQEMEQPDAKPVPAESMLTVVNNADWIRPLSLLDFMKEMGKYTRISDMMSRERYAIGFCNLSASLKPSCTHKVFGNVCDLSTVYPTWNSAISCYKHGISGIYSVNTIVGCNWAAAINGEISSRVSNLYTNVVDWISPIRLISNHTWSLV